MCDTISFKAVATMVFILLIMVPATSFSRENSLKGGLSVGFDYDDRSYGGSSDEYERILLSPMIEFKSLSEKDSFDLRLEPNVRYDLLDTGMDWDGSVRLAADRFITKNWQLGITENYLKTDYQNTDSGILTNPANPPEGVAAPSTEPQLSSKRYRTRYWLNSLNVFSRNVYKEDSSLRFGVGYDALRNEDSGVGGEEDYDRYVASVRNEHRYSPRWSSTLDLQFARGNFTPIVPTGTTGPTIDQLAGDLDEYRLLLSLDNESIIHNPLTLSYQYFDTVYDESLWNDTVIHMIRLTWRRDFSPHLYTKLGVGPSYEKTEGQDANWSENGIAEVNYSLEHGYVNFKVEKTYDVYNFSGSATETGAVDTWNSRLSASYQFRKDLALSGYLSYIYEDREQSVTLENSGGSGASQSLKYNDTIYGAGTALSYSFWQFYKAAVVYTYEKKDSELPGDDYDDNRILLTLSWEKEFFRW